MDDKNDGGRSWTTWIWLACLGLGVAFTTIASKLASIIGEQKNRSDSVENVDESDS